MKGCFILLILTVYSWVGKTQVSSENLLKSKNYLNAKVSFFAIEEKVREDPSLSAKFDSVKNELSNVKIDAALSYDELYRLLVSKFPKTLQVLSDPVNKINITAYQAITPPEAAQKLTDTVFMILKRS